MKTCFKCKETKEFSEFYKHSKMADGHLGKCKECTKKDVAKTRDDNIEYYRAYDRGRGKLPHRIKLNKKYIKTAEGKKTRKRGTTKYREKYPEKYAAVRLLESAVKRGIIKKGPCEICGKTKLVHGHHDDYYKPLDVRWLCVKHHTEHHNRLREAARSDNLQQI